MTKLVYTRSDIEGLIDRLETRAGSVMLADMPRLQADMRASGANNLSHVCLEGYLGAMLLVDGIRRAGPDLTEQRCVDALNHTNLDLQPLRIDWSSSDHSGSHAVFLTQIKNGKLESIQKLQPTTGH